MWSSEVFLGSHDTLNIEKSECLYKGHASATAPAVAPLPARLRKGYELEDLVWILVVKSQKFLAWDPFCDETFTVLKVSAGG